MSTEGNGPNFWVTLPGILTAVAGLVTAVTGLLIALNQMGVIGGDHADGASQSSGASSDTSQPPSPFESTQMYEMARYLFDPGECSPISSQSDAPLAWKLVPRPDELVRCTTSDATYSAVFMCNDTGDVTYIRETYLGKSVENTRVSLTQPPAGWDDVTDGVQKSFEHVDSNEARVYWDSPVRRCAAELQSHTASVSDTVTFWVNGPT